MTSFAKSNSDVAFRDGEDRARNNEGEGGATGPSTDDGPREPTLNIGDAGRHPIEPLPIQVIERNRLSVAEIRALPRFKDYSPGVPTKVNGLDTQVTNSYCTVYICMIFTAES